MTITSAVVECLGITTPGQLGVALGRATTISGLQVKFFRDRHIIIQPQHVTSYYDETILPFVEDMTCCRQHIEIFNDAASSDVVVSEEDSKPDGSDLDNEGLDYIDVGISSILDERALPCAEADDIEVDYAALVENAHHKVEITTLHKQINSLVHELYENKVNFQQIWPVEKFCELCKY